MPKLIVKQKRTYNYSSSSRNYPRFHKRVKRIPMRRPNMSQVKPHQATFFAPPNKRLVTLRSYVTLAPSVWIGKSARIQLTVTLWKSKDLNAISWHEFKKLLRNIVNKSKINNRTNFECGYRYNQAGLSYLIKLELLTPSKLSIFSCENATCKH